MNKILRRTIQFSNGRELSIESGILARQADSSVVLRMGDAMLLATVCLCEDANPNADFLGLTVEYQERFAAAGKIPGGFLKREGKLGASEILVSRLIDRPIRPLFPKWYQHANINVNVLLLSNDTEVVPDVLAALASSIALSLSSAPFLTPISEVRVVKVDGKFLINPSSREISNSSMNLIVAGSCDNILMVEGEMSEICENELVEAIECAHSEIKPHCLLQKELMAEFGAAKTCFTPVAAIDAVVGPDMRKNAYDQYYEVVKLGIKEKKQRNQRFDEITAILIEQCADSLNFELSAVKSELQSVQTQAIRDVVLRESKRLDGRKIDEIREISSQVNYLPTAHGSALFIRGHTQSLTTVTLGSKMDEQLIDSVRESGYNNFMLHYNFPGFCTGEVKANRGVSRREIGHGNLALRAISAVLPSKNENPYTIRVVSDILESNGSSSMATVCAASLALMDAGVKIKRPVAGIAMGLIVDQAENEFAVLSDILGDEDAIGDMDFKIAGTQCGITACQMDIKINGISFEMLRKALEQAKIGRLFILDKMHETIAAPRLLQKTNAPKVVNIQIPKKYIGSIIGPSGRTIQEIQKNCGVTISVEELNNFGEIKIYAANSENASKAQHWIANLIQEPEVGKTYSGVVKSVVDFGAFVEFMVGKEGLLHISEVQWGARLENLDGILNVGDKLDVKLVDYDKKTNKFRLSRKALVEKPA